MQGGNIEALSLCGLLALPAFENPNDHKQVTEPGFAKVHDEHHVAQWCLVPMPTATSISGALESQVTTMHRLAQTTRINNPSSNQPRLPACSMLLLLSCLVVSDCFWPCTVHSIYHKKMEKGYCVNPLSFDIVSQTSWQNSFHQILKAVHRPLKKTENHFSGREEGRPVKDQSIANYHYAPGVQPACSLR